MVKVFLNNKIRILNEAYIRVGKEASENFLDVHFCKKNLSSAHYALHVWGDIYDRDIVTFLDSEGIMQEGIVLKNAYYTTVIECPAIKKRFSLRQYHDSVKVIGTALDPMCKEEYRCYHDRYVPITSVKFQLVIGSQKTPCELNRNFRIEVATGTLISDIKLSDYGQFPERRVPITLKANEYGVNYGEVHVHDIVRFSSDEGESSIGTVAEDEFGAFIKFEDKQLSLIKNSCAPVGNLLFGDNISSFLTSEAPCDESKTVTTANDNKIYEIYTDGSAATNPGPCGYGYIIVSSGEVISKDSKFLGDGTSNIAELTAIKDALIEAATKDPKMVTVISDSKYCIDGITKWSNKWVKNGFVNSEGNDIANKTLWKEVIALVNDIRSRCDLRFNWVKGHSNNIFNEECDRLAKTVIANAFG